MFIKPFKIEILCKQTFHAACIISDGLRNNDRVKFQF